MISSVVVYKYKYKNKIAFALVIPPGDVHYHGAQLAPEVALVASENGRGQWWLRVLETAAAAAAAVATRMELAH